MAREIVETVTGPVAASELGFTLSHEHVIVGFPGIKQTYPELMDWEGIESGGIAKLSEARAEGLQSIMDATPFELGRDVLMLKRVSEGSGVNIIASTGTYVDIPRLIWFTHPDRMAAVYIREITEGIEGTGIKAGMIKVADNNFELSNAEEMVLRAASRASNETDIPITTHTQPQNRVGEPQWRIFAEEGVDPARVCIGHSSDSTEFDYLEGLAREGVFLGMDELPGHQLNEPWREKCDMIKRLIDAGFAGQLMLSHDWSVKLHPDDSWGASEEKHKLVNPDDYAFIGRNVLPYLREQGVDEEAIRLMTVDNPRRFLAGE